MSAPEEGDLLATNGTTAEPGPDLMDQELLSLLELVNAGILCLCVGVFGCVTNIVNMVVFRRIGLKDTTNISLFSLAVSDFGACFTTILLGTMYNPLVRNAGLPIITEEFLFPFSVYPHVLFAKATTVITAIITFERCICVAFPLRVKMIMSVNKVKVLIIIAFLTTLSGCLSMYYLHQTVWKFNPELNISQLGIVFVDNIKEIEAIYYPIYNTIYSNLMFIIIITCTTILIVLLRRKMQWRQSTATSAPSKGNDAKESRITKMMVIISSMFLGCYFPFTMVSFLESIDADFSYMGKDAGFQRLILSLSFLMETVNSSLNIFVYYHYSSNYRAMFDTIFGVKNDGDKRTKK